MCDNIIILYLFMFLKIIAIVILPIIIFIKRKKEYVKYLIYVDIVILLFFLICNIFTINSCVYNSNFDGIERTKNKNQIILYNKLHPKKESGYSSYGFEAEKKDKTIKNKTLYYYNQTKQYMNNAYYECNGKRVYIDSFGSGITSLSIALSTLYDKELNPIEIFDYYKQDNINLCEIDFNIESVYNSVMKRYGGIKLSQISSSEVYNSISNGDLVIAELTGNEKSKITCDKNYIVIYNIALDGKYKIAIPNQTNYDYVCSYSSEGYGNIIKSDNMEKTWTMEEINNEAVRYYLVKKG